MELLVDRLQLAPVDLCVDLGRGDGGVAQHLLDDAKVGSSGKQVCREGVAELVGMDRFLDAGALGIQPYDLPDSGGGQCMTAYREKDLPSGFG